MNLKDIDISGYDTLLLDRDGVINRLRPNDYVKCWDEFCPGFLKPYLNGTSKRNIYLLSLTSVGWVKE